jgi:hypothetical protein
MSDLDHLGSLAAAGLVYSLRGVKERVVLEVVREMAKHFPPHRTQNATARTTPDAATTDPPKTRIPRIYKLARKDTLWYLCSILHMVFNPYSASSAAHLTSKMSHACVFAAKCQNKLLEDAILTGLSSIIGRSSACRCFTSPSQNKNTKINEPRAGDSVCGDNENGKLSGKCLHRTTVDEVGDGMILGAAERVWLYLFSHGTDNA